MDDVNFIIRLVLYSESSKTQNLEILSFSSFPTTIEIIKDKIESCCSIPSCVQSVFYQDNEVPGNCSTSSLYIRSGDTLRVYYPAKGEMSDVKEFTKELALVAERVNTRFHEIEQDKNLSNITNDPFFPCTSLEVLGKTLFSPWLDPATKHVNSTHFAGLHGVEILSSLHCQVIKLRRQTSIYYTYMLELLCIETCRNFAVSKAYARRFLQCGELDNCIDTLLITPADGDLLIYDNLYKLIEMALGLILKYVNHFANLVSRIIHGRKYEVREPL